MSGAEKSVHKNRRQGFFMISLQTLFSSSAGNSILLSGKNSDLLIDCGVSARRIANKLTELGKDAKQLRGIVITHEHDEHIRGLFVLSKRLGIPVYAHRETAGALLRMGSVSDLTVFEEDVPFAVGDFVFTAFPTPHDTPVSVGFRIECPGGGKKIGVCSDLGHVTNAVRRALTGADAVYIESNHDLSMLMAGPYPYFLKKRISGENGHLSNDDCAELCRYLLQTGTERFLLGHLSAHNNLDALALQTTRAALCEEKSPFCLATAPKFSESETMCL
jgi:phosphoribosyl 1,2-cyclic phosphodiesterase